MPCFLNLSIKNWNVHVISLAVLLFSGSTRIPLLSILRITIMFWLPFAEVLGIFPVWSTHTFMATFSVVSRTFTITSFTLFKRGFGVSTLFSSGMIFTSLLNVCLLQDFHVAFLGLCRLWKMFVHCLCSKSWPRWVLVVFDSFEPRFLGRKPCSHMIVQHHFVLSS